MSTPDPTSDTTLWRRVETRRLSEVAQKYLKEQVHKDLYATDNQYSKI